MLARKSKSFYKFHSFVTGLRDCQKLVVIILRTSFQNFHPNFYLDLNSRFIQGELCETCDDHIQKQSPGGVL